MNSALSLTLIVCLAEPAVPTMAQQEIRLEPSSLARSIARETSRLAADSMSPDMEAVQPEANRAGSDWSRIRTLEPGTAIIVTARGVQPRKRFAVRADESTLTLRAAGQTLETVARADVVEIRTERVRGHTGAWVAAFAVAGALLGASIQASKRGGLGSEGGFREGWLLGAPIGAGIGVGAGLGVGLSTSRDSEIVYQAP
jgi:hypothetical protein